MGKTANALASDVIMPLIVQNIGRFALREPAVSVWRMRIVHLTPIPQAVYVFFSITFLLRCVFIPTLHEFSKKHLKHTFKHIYSKEYMSCFLLRGHNYYKILFLNYFQLFN